MNLRRVAIVVGAAIAIVGGGIGIGWWLTVHFTPEAYLDIDQAELQARLEARFPQKNCAMMVACVTLSAPKVALAEDSERIGLAADVLVTLGRRQIPGKVAFSGTLRYVQYQGDFYLDDVRIDELALSGFPPEYAEIVKSRGPGAMRRAVEGHPIYSIKGDTAKEKLIRFAVRDVRVTGGKVRVTFLRFGGG
jgi:hypothetical protein